MFITSTSITKISNTSFNLNVQSISSCVKQFDCVVIKSGCVLEGFSFFMIA